MPAGSSQFPKKQVNKGQYDILEPEFDTREFMPYISTTTKKYQQQTRAGFRICAATLDFY